MEGEIKEANKPNFPETTAEKQPNSLSGRANKFEKNIMKYLAEQRTEFQ